MADLFIGLMSGSSMDSIDAGLVNLSSTRPTIIATHSRAYPAALHQRLETALKLDNPLSADTAVAVTGFDTGPWNTRVDYWSQQHLNTAKNSNCQ
jgi:1,6-anhydro-N-acetylmuramate kinase